MKGMRRFSWLLVGGAVVAALVYAQIGRPNSDAFMRNRNGQALMQTYQLIQDEYLQKLDQKKLDAVIQGGIRGMISALDDQFTSYTAPTSSSIRSQDLQGEFYGIGVSLSLQPAKGGGAQIIGVTRGLPGYNAGLKVGDVITEVNGQDVTKLEVDEIVSKIRGPKDTKVTIGVRRDGSNAVIKFEMVRQKVEIISVTKAILPGNVGYVALETFANVKVFDQLNAALKEMRDKGVKKLVFDLRDNGGGLLDQGCQVAEAFIKEGPIVFTRYRTQTKLFCEASGRVQWSGPMVVLVNGNSASASEIVAGAIQDTGRAKVIGESTFGKGVGQNVIDLPNGGELTLVTFEWLTPKKRALNKTGVKPDIEVKDTRFEVPLAFEGTGVKPGETVTLNVGGKTYTAKADEKGKFTFSQTLPPRPQSEDRGQAVIELEKDAILQRALEELK